MKIAFATRIWLKNFSLANIKNKPSLGIIVGRNKIWAVHSSVSKQTRQVDWVEVCSLQQSLFTGKPNSTVEKELHSFFKLINSRIGKKFVHVQVSLPDPAALIGFYPIDTVPRNTAQCRELAAWRISKQFYTKDKSMACDYQLTGESGGKQILMAIGLDADWLKFWRKVLQESGILAPVIDLGINHQFNQLDGKEKTECGVLIDLSHEYWSVIVWNEKGAPCFIRSRWRKQQENTPATELADIANEIIQTLLVYSHDGQNMSIDKVLMSGQQTEWEILAAHLQQHMTRPVEYIDNSMQGMATQDAVEQHSLPAMAYAVVIPR